MSRTQLQHIFRVAVGCSLVAVIVHKIELEQLLALAKSGEPARLGLGAGFLVVGMLGLQWTRLHVLIRSYTQSWRTSLEIFYVGALFNNLLPSNLGGDAIRLLYLRGLREGSLGTPFMLLLAYRASSFAVLLVAGIAYVLVEHARLFALVASLPWQVQLDGRALGLLACASALAAGLGLWLRTRSSERLRARISDFVCGCRAAFDLLPPHVVASLMLQTVLFHLCRVLSFYFLVGFAGQHIVLWDLVFVLWISALANLLPISVAGFGVVEAAITGLLSLYGVDVTCAGAVALVNRAVMLLAAGIGAVIYLRSGLPSAGARARESHA